MTPRIARPIAALALALSLSGAPALAAPGSGATDALSGKPSATACSQALTWVNRAAAIAQRTATDAVELLDERDPNGALVVSVIGRHDLAAVPNPGAAKTLRSADLAVLDNLIYQIARGIDDPYGYAWDDDSYSAAMAELKAERRALDAACGFVSDSATGGV